ncbi:MAG TPA: S41 family peptidase [Rhizomicrobium sp.]
MIPAGLWQSRGYGWLLDVAPAGDFTVYDITQISGVAVDSGPLFEEVFDNVVCESPSVLRLTHRGDVTTYWFDRLGAMPAQCAGDFASDDARRNFEVLWRQFRENYAFFPLRGVDWEQSYRTFRPRVGANISREDLWQVFRDLIGPLRDTHVKISDGPRTLDVTSPIRDRKQKLIETFNAPPWSESRLKYTQVLQQALGDMFLGGRFRTASNHMMIYGEIAPAIGYVTLFGEFGHAGTPCASAALDLPRPRAEAAPFLADEIAAINASLDEIAIAFADMRAVIVDARLNYGGYDRLALEFAGLFTDQPRVAYRKKAWTGNGFTSSQDIGVALRKHTLAHLPVALLTSKQTASAGEILVLGMMACPNVTRIGEATLGILSDNLYKPLPIGWEVSLSNEVYEAPDGALYEAIGIPPEIETPVFDPADVRAGLHIAVQRALEFLRTRLHP